VTGNIVLTNAGAVISARGNLSARALCECSRCLLSHPVDLEVEVNEECRLSPIDSASGADAQPIPILDGDTVGLSELVRQVLALSLPPRPLCRPDCHGLCPQCGRNLNAVTCDCEPDAPDPRWDRLRSLLDGR